MLPIYRLLRKTHTPIDYLESHTNDFRMYQYKIKRCQRSIDNSSCFCSWCPFAHPGDKSIRRHPRHYHYSVNSCHHYRNYNYCPRGNTCKFAHGFYEYWLHPSRYRTQLCKDGHRCKRNVCFFAHGPDQIRVLPLKYDKACADIPEEILVEIFQKLSVEELVYVVPFVCKSWHQASLNPNCWKYLDFNLFNSTFDVVDINELIKWVIRQSSGSAIEVSLPYSSTIKDSLAYIANRCPTLKFLDIVISTNARNLSNVDFDEHEQHLAQLICKMKDLEVLSLGHVSRWFNEILVQISIHCKNFVMLNVYGELKYNQASAIVDILPKIKDLKGLSLGSINHGFKEILIELSIHCKDFVMLNAYCGLTPEQASAIVDILPSIKCLGLIKSRFNSRSLKLILAGCRDLELLDISSSICVSVSKEDNRILKTLKSSSHIKTVVAAGTLTQSMYHLGWNFLDELELVEKFVEKEKA